jgi:hypothetical protein
MIKAPAGSESHGDNQNNLADVNHITLPANERDAARNIVTAIVATH